MPNTSPPGQLAYETWEAALPARFRYLGYVHILWEDLAPDLQAAWEAAAQAVLALQKEKDDAP